VDTEVAGRELKRRHRTVTKARAELGALSLARRFEHGLDVPGRIDGRSDFYPIPRQTRGQVSGSRPKRGSLSSAVRTIGRRLEGVPHERVAP